ncbi:MAG: hypothetical protein NC489_27790 [Ruminococcus flavefaciens]|nr:hypothetical protein [Roseburia sp.]MCM1233926.1 hypothetical protein [Ruminococcus flavefaciens]
MKYFSEEYFDGLKDIALQYTFNNYDYCYLRTMHEKNRREGTKTIIAGSSHAMNGVINENISGGCINFSISSQDIYFDFQHIKKAVEEGRQRIEHCIINIGYYMLYQDLSFSKVMSYLIPSVYYPLFGNAHHYEMQREYDMYSKLKIAEGGGYSTGLLKKVCEEWSEGFFLEEPSYYGSMKTRENNNIFGLKKIIWNTLTEEEKERAAIERTNDHNRLKQHEQSRIENGKIVSEMIEYLYAHSIIPIFVIFPFTAWYNRYIDKDYKADIFQLLDRIPFPVEFLDMNDYEGIFCDADFLDTDHLNKQGALKATELLNKYIEILKQE